MTQQERSTEDRPFPDAAGSQVHLRLLATSDMHGQVWSYDYVRDIPGQNAGLAPLGTLIRQLRSAAPNTLLLDNGDSLQGTPLTDWAAFERKGNSVHPVIAAMNALGYDAATIGNHEFNYGLSVLQDALADATFPVVLANLLDGLTDKAPTLFPPYTILEREVRDTSGRNLSLRIGILGLTPPQVVNWDAKHLEGRVTAQDIVESAGHWLPRIRKAGADFVIALCHSGIETGHASHYAENAALALARLPGLDAIVAGHLHQQFPGPGWPMIEGIDADAGTLFGLPAVMPGFAARHLGLIDLLIEPDTTGWAVRGHRSNLVPIPENTPDDPDVIEATRSEHEATLAYVRRPIGHTLRPLHSYFAQITDSPALRIVADAKRWFASQELATTSLAGVPLLCSVSPFRAGGLGGPGHYCDIPAGALTLRHAFELYEYPNLLRILRLTGAELREWLERSASIYHTIPSGSRDRLLINPSYRPYHFDIVDGASFEIDLSQPGRYTPEGDLAPGGGRRIRNLSYRRRPVQEGDTFLLVSNDYRTGGGGAFPGCTPENIVFSSQIPVREAVTRYLARHDPTDIALRADWGFVSMPGATAIFETGTRAVSHMDDLPRRRLEAAGHSDAGFARYRLFL